MKTYKFKDMVKYAWLLLAMVVVFAACKDDTPDPDPDPEVLVEDGLYIKGDATALTELDAKGFLSVAKNEVVQEPRTSLFEIYIAVKGSGSFSIVEVAGSETKTYGPGSDFAVVAEADRDTDEPKVDFYRGTYTETETGFTVPADGLYHVVMDTELGKIAVAPVVWGVIGAATPGGWGESTPMPATGFDLETMTFELAEVTLTASDWKFRYNDGWKIILDAEYDLGDGNKGVRVNTNFGGSISALEAGGDNFSNDTYGVYKATMTWELGKAQTASLEWVKEGEALPEYPEAMYLVGAASAYGWDTPGDKAGAVMHKIAGGGDNDGVFWKIASLKAGEGFKLSAAGWSEPNLGYNEVSEFDAEGVAVGEDGGNMTVAEAGIYTIVLDLRNDAKKVSIKAAEVYGMGDAFGGWDAGVAGNLFTVDVAANTVTSPALPAGGNIRMYVSHSWIPDWWNAEFVVVDGAMEYRNDSTNDPTAVAGTAGQVITLNFDDNTGSIQ